NIPEAEILLGHTIDNQTDITGCARELSQGKVSVLLKAGHCEGNELTDVLYNNETKEIVYLKSSRIETKNTHGTGCTLSSAVAAFLAQKYSLNDAVQAAKQYLHKAIENGSNYVIGGGHGPVNHFFNNTPLSSSLST
ncbi:MAG: hydroxymethylpyrimidine/phosphomethylpyrimidine kinase, partial [Bacteroidetes bacterium]|nr:hydroxymethylpyrimidine/phosphomethylpyrimidine kinase [Bacteroidota bacterium]